MWFFYVNPLSLELVQPEYMICIILWCLFIIPGCVYAFYIIHRAEHHMPTYLPEAHKDQMNSPYRTNEPKKLMRRPSDILKDHDHLPIELMFAHPEQLNSPYRGNLNTQNPLSNTFCSQYYKHTKNPRHRSCNVVGHPPSIYCSLKVVCIILCQISYLFSNIEIFYQILMFSL